jgi:hypothetical protein
VAEEIGAKRGKGKEGKREKAMREFDFLNLFAFSPFRLFPLQADGG